MSPMTGGQFPANASPEMKEFIENRAKLQASMDQLRQKNPGNPADPKLLAEFQQENKDLLQRQRELASKLAEQQVKNPLPPLRPLQVPPNATPQMKAYLTDRDQLMRDQVAFMNLHRTDAPAQRQVAMQEWRQQNATRFQRLKEEAQAIAQSK